MQDIFMERHHHEIFIAKHHHYQAFLDIQFDSITCKKMKAQIKKKRKHNFIVQGGV